MQKSILYIASTLDEVYECAYSILKYLEVYNLKPPASHSLVVYTKYPELLETYGSFFNQFQLRTLPENADKQSILEQFKKEAGEDVFYFDSNTYPVKQIDDEKSIQSYKGLKEFKVLLKDFFGRYQEESVPNQVKLIHNVDAKEIEIQKKKFENLPITSKWLRKLMGRGWSIYNYQVKI
ncbi:MAG: hypothetical protein J7502_06990 [Flavisolibacter sp.]|nr:hypothetical protein [Flavisolibacter sp.]